jgi:hypothetical protein
LPTLAPASYDRMMLILTAVLAFFFQRRRI